ncbi:MAG TPA: response regulator [Flavisolibacter sp.]|jgi:two-component system LytT family response regulator|nr:response regulator [Flavisolibacter sp.]
MKQSVLIIDDESDARRLIRQYLSSNINFEIIGECNNGPDAVSAIDKLEPDLVFLDIKMPGLSGLQVVQQIIHRPQIIFTTAYDRYALRAFDANATDYLLKPYTRERFDKAVSKILHHSRSHFEDIKMVANAVANSQAGQTSTILVESGSKLIALALREIVCMEAEKDYTRMHTAATSYLSNFGISQLEQRLPHADFIRIHRSFIVNIHHIKEVHKGGTSAYLTTSTDKIINISRKYLPVLKKFIY